MTISVANWKPVFGETILEQGSSDEDVAWWMDYFATSSCGSFASIWGNVDPNLSGWAVQFMQGIRLGIVTGADLPQDSSKNLFAPHSTVEEFTMLCGAMDILFPDKGRLWQELASAPVPRKLKSFGAIVQDVKRINPDLDDADVHARAEDVVRMNRMRLTWAAAAVYVARDLVQHGQAIPISFSPEGPWEKSKILGGFVVFPPSGVSGLKLRDGFAFSGYQLKTIERLTKAIRSCGSELADAEIKEHLMSILKSSASLTDAIITFRASLFFALIESYPEFGKDAKKDLMAHFGWPDGRPSEQRITV